MRISQSLVLPSSREQAWHWAFWGSLLACEVMGLILSSQA